MGEPVEWMVVVRSVCGAKHLRREQPNQDAGYAWPGREASPCAFVALADGHGGNQSPRSETGAQLAVNAARTLVIKRFEEVDAAPLATLAADIPTLLVPLWRMAVASDIAENPFAEPCSDPYTAYGSTLMLAAASAEGVLLAQLGDGDILAVADTGATTRPLPDDPRLTGTETTSLCGANPTADWRITVLPVTDLPALLLLSTDGYVNAFRSEADFLKVGPDMLGMIRTHGLAAVAEQLGDWLAAASAEGSGDDVTLGILCRADIARGMTNE